MKIILGLPPKALSPNARVHWRTKAKAFRDYKDAAATSAWAMNRHEPRWKWATAKVRFMFKDYRRRDPDNFMAMLKPVWDGLKSVDILEDDNQLVLMPPSFHVDPKYPRVEIVVEPAQENETCTCSHCGRCGKKV